MGAFCFAIFVFLLSQRCASTLRLFSSSFGSITKDLDGNSATSVGRLSPQESSQTTNNLQGELSKLSQDKHVEENSPDHYLWSRVRKKRSVSCDHFYDPLPWYERFLPVSFPSFGRRDRYRRRFPDCHESFRGAPFEIKMILEKVRRKQLEAATKATRTTTTATTTTTTTKATTASTATTTTTAKATTMSLPPQASTTAPHTTREVLAAMTMLPLQQNKATRAAEGQKTSDGMTTLRTTPALETPSLIKMTALSFLEKTGNFQKAVSGKQTTQEA